MGPADQSERLDKPSRKQRLEAVISQCEATLEREPDNVEACLSLATALACQRRFHEALVPLHDLAAKMPEHPAIEYLIGRIYHLLGDSAAAAEHLHTVHRYEFQNELPHDFRLQYMMGRNQIAVGDLRKAAFTFGRAMGMRPDSEIVAVSMGRVLLGQGRRPKALTFLQKAGKAARWWPDVIAELAPRERAPITIRPTREPRAPRAPRVPRVPAAKTPAAPAVDVEATLRLATELACKRRFDSALETLEKLVAVAPRHPQAAYLIGRIHHMQGNPAAAVEPLYAASRAIPGDFRLQYMLGRCQMAAGDVRRAIFSFDRAVALRPQSEVANVFMGRALLAHGRRTNGLSYLKKAGAAARWWPDVLAETAPRIVKPAVVKQPAVKKAVRLAPAPGLAPKPAPKPKPKPVRPPAPPAVPEAMDESTAALRTKVEELLRARQFRDAENICLAALEDTPDNPVVATCLAMALAAQRRGAEAIQYLRRVIEITPQNLQARELLARLYAKLNRPTDAAEQITAMGAPARRSFRLQYLLARCHLKEGDARLCTFAITRAIALRPGSEAAHATLGIALCRTGRWRNSVDAFAKAEGLLRVWPTAAALYASALLNFRRYSEAEEWYGIALRGEPDNIDHALGQADALIALRAAESALSILDAVRPHATESARYFYMLGVANHELVHGTSGEADLQKAAELHEETPGQLDSVAARKLYLLLGEIALQDGRYGEAGNHLQKAREATPQDAHILLLLSLAKYRMGAWREAADLAAESIEAAPLKPEPDAHVLLGMALLSLGEQEAADEALTRATELSPFSGDAFFAIARIRHEQGDWEAAERALARVKKVAPHTQGLEELRAAVAAELGRPLNDEADAADITQIEIADIFKPPPLVELAPPSLGRALPIHLRVVKALMVREMLTRFGRSRIGYLWALLQPIMLILTLYLVFSFANRRLPAGVSLETFLLTGVIPLYLFIQTKARLSRAIISNRTLFYFRQVTPLSVLLARTYLEFATYLTVFFVIFGLIAYFAEPFAVESYLGVILCLATLGLMGFGAGSIFGVLMPRFEVLEHASMVINRIVFFTSGMFFYGNELPPKLRDVLLINPLFHVIEFLRGAFYPSYTPLYASMTYVAAWTAALLLGGLVLERYGRRLAAT